MPSARRKPMNAPTPPERFAARKPARFGARLTEDQKLLFERAAALTGRSLTDFVIGAAQEVATRTIHDFEIMKLSERNSRALIEALLNPAAPNPQLRRAFRRYEAEQGRRASKS
jgi:uncharacterized protein (DUF1778 family)